jgi:hypothetical protein
MSVTLLSPEQVCELIPGMTKENLAQLRFRKRGPAYIKVTPRVIVYDAADVEAYLQAQRVAQVAS